MWFGSWMLVIRKLPGWQERGAFGDMFGAVGSLFSGLAFIGLIVTIYLQLEQLKDTRKELKSQREEMIAQTETLRKQRFEDTFFQLLKLQSDIVASMDIDVRTGITRRGRDCFVVMYNELYQTFRQMGTSQKLENEIVLINLVFQEFYRKRQADLAHYFNHLRSIVEFVHSSERPDRNFYINLVRSELSTHEQLLLFYYGLSTSPSGSFKPLIEEYDILRSMPQNNLMATQHVAFYESLTTARA